MRLNLTRQPEHAFDLKASSTGGGDPDGNDTTIKSDEEVIESDTWTTSSFYVFDPAGGEPNEVDQVTGNYTFAGGGLVHEHAEAQYADSTGIEDIYWVLAPGGDIVTNYEYGNGPSGDGFGSSGPFPLPLEQGALSLQNLNPAGSLENSQAEGGNTKVTYFVGGTGQLNQQVLLAATATVQDGQVVEYLGANEFGGGPTFDDSQVTDESLGQQGSDGWAVKAEAAGAPVGVTPTATGPMQFPAWPNAGAAAPISTTVHPALTDTNLHRTNLGVGEQVTLSFSQTVPVPLTWTTTAGGVDQFGNFTAPSNACSATVTVTASNGATLSFPTFTVFAPSGYDHAVITSTHKPFNFTVYEAGAAMHQNVWIAPTSVSFYRVQMMEVGEDASGNTGYFAYGVNPEYFTTSDLSHKNHGAGHWFGPLSENNEFSDDCSSGPWFQPWEGGGGFTWNIPVCWKIGDNGQTNSIAGWNQIFSMDASGTMTITKYGQSVSRTINGVINPDIP